MKNSILLIAAGLLAALPVQGQLFIPTVKVGDAGNANDFTGFGAVSNDYHIGQHEVTNAQYTAFLNAVAATDTHNLYNPIMTSSTHGGIQRSGTSGGFTYSTKSGFENKPVNFVSFWDAARFSNWLTNGQGSGDTETGMYNLGGVTNPTNSSVTRQIDFSSGQNGVAIASENEWYKAAYYNGSSYFDFPTQSDTSQTATGPNSTNANSANYLNAVGTVTNVGSYTLADSHYGTFDQGGNVWEWNDAILLTSDRGLRGGSFFGFGVLDLESSVRDSNDPASGSLDVGFRVSSLAPIGEIPEPAHVGGVALLLLMGWIFMRRRTLQTFTLSVVL